LAARNIFLPIGVRGLELSIPDSVDFTPPQNAIESGAALSELEQQAIVRAAIERPLAGPPLKELAKSHRRVCIVVGDLSLPAPYWIALPPIVASLVEAEIRPTRISFLAYPNASGEVLGRAAIRRYGEEIVGDHELRTWKSPDENSPDPLYAAADLKLAVLPTQADVQLSLDAAIHLQLGRKATIDITAATLSAGKPPLANPKSKIQNPKSDVFLTSGGGADWETTLEEATLSLHAPLVARTAVLAFGGADGLGSSRFARDLWSMLEEAENVLQGQGTLPSLPDGLPFDPASALAGALSGFERLVLFSSEFAAHSEGEDLFDRLSAWPKMAQRLHLCAGDAQLWELLKRFHGESYHLHAEPLGWRSLAIGL
jgi:hypothetical protein